eukprot:NODE_2281_length_1159_cov_8.631532_g1891_i0.p1 GENE.NODE_2281_length_1159_cov_8.631532_g1891_i0~~NODE_2281_length_1159_cov_8.631532_g1891_i0.p1  ORF type:complete len:332 (+),score=57.34 NODE_2281_length_1159_cov_8.631532_g1891_i0:106-1101(+)
MFLCNVFGCCYGLPVAALLVGAAYAVARHYASQFPTEPERSSQPRRFIDPSSKEAKRAPPTTPVSLSVVIPCYNEEERLPIMLSEAIEHFTQRSKADPSFTWELIVVNDCSKDKTLDVALRHAATLEKSSGGEINCVSYTPNGGKGFAVKQGMLIARGEMILMADGDAATKISDLDRLESSLRQLSGAGKTGALGDRQGIIVGSRYHLMKDAVAERSILRTFLMHGFHFLVTFTYSFVLWKICPIHDTQCGFKLFTRKTAKDVFSSLHLNRWAFDVELLILASARQHPVLENAVNWKEIEGSKLNVWGMAKMAFELLLVCAAYPFRLWTLR